MIRALLAEELPAFRALAEAAGYIYARPAWMENVPCTPYGIFGDGGELRGGFLIHEQRVWGQLLLRTPAFCASIGPFFDPCMEGSGMRGRANQRRIGEELAAHLTERRPVLMALALDSRHQDMLPFQWNGFKATPGLTFRLDLDQGEDALLAATTAQRRQQLRKAAKAGVETVVDHDLDSVLAMVRLTFGRQDTQLDLVRLERLFGALRHGQDWYVVKGTVENRVANASLYVHSRDTAYHLFGGYDPELRSTQAGAAVMWRAITEAAGRGLACFDFEGSMLPAVERFYADFGGRPVHAFRLSHGRFWAECLAKLRRRSQF